MLEASDSALSTSAPKTMWQRLPLLPGFFGRMLIRSQAPDATRKFTAPAPARPTASEITSDVIQRFVEQHRQAAERVRGLDEQAARAAIMTSPFVRFITYSVLDGWRLVVTHDRRHFEQARRVTQSPGFPAAS
jgi:hypothetical protein